jgi:serine/threonine-protein kinase
MGRDNRPRGGVPSPAAEVANGGGDLRAPTAAGPTAAGPTAAGPTAALGSSTVADLPANRAEDRTRELGRASEPPRARRSSGLAAPLIRPSGSVTASLPSGSSASSLGSASLVGSATRAPLDALDRDELRRTRWFCYVSFVILVVAGGAVSWLGGDPVAVALMLGAIGASALATAFMLVRTRDPARFRQRSTLIGWLVPAAAATMAIPYFGAFSPAAVVLVLGIFFTGLGKSRRLAYVVYAGCAAVQGGVALLSITGATRDVGLVHAGGLGVAAQLIVQGLVQFVFATTLFVARMSRRTQLLAIEELEREVRISAHREALLLEAREQLDRALRPGRGRFSDQQIGAYVLGAVLGRGAMGEVYEATGPAGAVAIKLLAQASLGNANHVLRFLRELHTAAAIDAPNVVKVIEVGEHPVPYLVMERLEGKTLADVLRGRRALAAEEVIDLVRQIGAGITAAGAAGVVHRDLKPQNVFRHGETWKILDFGVARALDHGDTLTAGQVVGTPAYMAPEQATGRDVGHAADLYALAAIAYRALTGHPLFGAGDMAEVLYKVVHTAPRRPSDLVTGLPREADLVLAIGLAKRAADRFASAHELVEALAAALGGRLAPPVLQRGLALSRTGAWSESSRPRARTARD